MKSLNWLELKKLGMSEKANAVYSDSDFKIYQNGETFVLEFGVDTIAKTKDFSRINKIIESYAPDKEEYINQLIDRVEVYLLELEAPTFCKTATAIEGWRSCQANDVLKSLYNGKLCELTSEELDNAVNEVLKRYNEFKKEMEA